MNQKHIIRKGLALAIICLFIGASVTTSMSGNIEPSKNIREKNIKSESLAQAEEYVGNTGYEPWYYYIGGMINSANGNLYLSMKDISIEALGFDIEIIRSYNSHNSDILSGFGYGWTFNHNTYLVDNSGSVLWYDGDGSVHIFTEPIEGNYTSPPGVHARLNKNVDNSFTLWFKSGGRYDFDIDGVLQIATDKNGNSLSYTYSGGDLVEIADDSGMYLTFSYLDDMITTITDNRGRSISYDYDDNDNLIMVTDAMGYTTQYSYYDDSHYIKSCIDRTGDELSFDYNIPSDPEPWTVESVYRSWRDDYSKTYLNPYRVFNLTYEGNCTEIIDAEGYKTSIMHNAMGNPSEATDSLGFVAGMTWDDDMNMLSATDANGNTYTFEYDTYGNIVDRVDPLGNSSFYSWTTIDNVVQYISLLNDFTDELGFTTEFEYDSFGNMDKTIDATGNITEYVYDTYGNIVEGVNARGYSTSFSYDTHGNMKNLTDPMGNITEYVYDNVGRLTDIIDANGHTSSIIYDDNDRIIRVIDASCCGNETIYNYNAEGELVSVIDANEQETQYNQNILSVIDTATDALGNETFFRYDRLGNPKRVTDARESKTEYAYDARGRLISFTDALGNTGSYTYDDAGNILTAEDRLGYVTQYEYDSLNRLIKITDALEKNISYSYDARDNCISITDKRDYTTAYEYDPLNRLIKTTYPVGPVGTCRLQYDNGTPASYLGSWNVGDQQAVYYDPAALCTECTQVYPLIINHVEGLFYDFAGVGTVDVIIHFYEASDPCDGPGAEIYSFGTTITTFYPDVAVVSVPDTLCLTDDFFLAVEYISGITGEIPSLMSDNNPPVDICIQWNEYLDYGWIEWFDFWSPPAPGWLMLRAVGTCNDGDCEKGMDCWNEDDDGGVLQSYDSPNAIGDRSATYYDSEGNRISFTDKNGHIPTKGCDSLDGLIKTTGVPGYYETYSYDPVGNLIDFTDRNGHTTTYEYNALDQLIKTTDPEGHYETYSYDPVGNLIGFTDKNGHTTNYEYDELNQLTKTTDAESYFETYSYDDVGNLIAVTDANFHTTSYAYDALNRRINTETPLGYTSVYEYDENSNLRDFTDPTGNTITREYDDLNRLISKQYFDNYGGYQGTISYEYDPNGNLLLVDGGSRGVIHYEYDELNRITSFTVDYEDYFSKETSYAYDENGNVISMINPDDEETVYTYDPLNRLVSILDPSAGRFDFTYDPAGRRIGTAFSDGAFHYSYSYDTANRLLDITTDTIIPEISYTYDNAGNRLTMTNGFDTTTYTYNDRDELLTETGTGPTFSAVYTYDGVGNRLTSDIDAVFVTYDYDDDNKLLSSSSGIGIDYLYDDNGNLILKNDNGGITEYEYDIDNNLINVILPDLSTIEYTICPLGMRIAKTTVLGTEYDFYDRGNRLLKLDNGGNTLYRYLQNPAVVDETLGYFDGVDWRFHAFDALGSIRFELDDGGTPVREVRYDAFGNSFDPAFEPYEYGFTGRRYDPETNLYYYRARMYDPEVGRFTSKDPIGMVDGSNMYSYVGNNPVNFVDPTGMKPLGYGKYSYTCTSPSGMFENTGTCVSNEFWGWWYTTFHGDTYLTCDDQEEICGDWTFEKSIDTGEPSGGGGGMNVLPNSIVAAAILSGGGGSGQTGRGFGQAGGGLGGADMTYGFAMSSAGISAQNQITTQIYINLPPVYVCGCWDGSTSTSGVSSTAACAGCPAKPLKPIDAEAKDRDGDWSMIERSGGSGQAGSGAVSALPGGDVYGDQEMGCFWKWAKKHFCPVYAVYKLFGGKQ